MERLQRRKPEPKPLKRATVGAMSRYAADQTRPNPAVEVKPLVLTPTEGGAPVGNLREKMK